MTKKIIFSAGGTGGHILPAINLMKHFSDKKCKVLLVTDNRGKNLLKHYSQFKSYMLRAGTPTNKNLFKIDNTGKLLKDASGNLTKVTYDNIWK